MPKTPEQKATEAKVARQLARAQKDAKLTKQQRTAQNQRVAQRILGRGRGK